MDPRKEAILLGMSLSPRSTRKVVHEGNEDVLSFFEVLDKLSELDPELEECLMPYFKLEHGRKLSPVLVAAHVLSRREKAPILEKHLTARIIDTPKRMAELLAYYKHLSGADSFKEIPYREKFREILEGYDRYTLIKNRMRRRKVKLADLIKALRPCPKNEEMSKLYKSIIENRGVSLKPEEHVTTLFSSDMEQEEREEALERNVDKMPINALLRNLRKIAREHPKLLPAVVERLDEVSRSVAAGDLKAVSTFNPFDLFDLLYGCYKDGGTVQSLVPPLSSILDEYVKQKISGFRKAKAAVLVDISGSMSMGGWFNVERSGILEAMKYLSLLPYMCKIEYMAFFNHRYFDEKDSLKKLFEKTDSLYLFENRSEEPVRELAKKGAKFSLYKNLLSDKFGVSKNFERLYEHHFLSLPTGMTALNDSMELFKSRCPDAEVYFVITDEMDNRKLANFEQRANDDFLKNNRDAVLFLINVRYNPKRAKANDAIFNNRVVRLTSLTPGFFEFFRLAAGDIEEIVNEIKAKYS